MCSIFFKRPQVSYLSQAPFACVRGSRCIVSKCDVFQEGDRFVFERRDGDLFISKPLRSDGVTHSRWGDIEHSSVIGKPSVSRIRTVRGAEARIWSPTLADYVVLTPRLVTPVYPADASLIVSLLDIHATCRIAEGQEGPSLEILEAGTGHGALTLYLARAIHAANAFVPSIQNSNDESVSDSIRAARQAVVHTVDISPHYSEHAKKIVQGFRQGLYSNNVDFYAGGVSQWIDQQIQKRHLEDKDDKSFLSHAVIDMPDSHQHLAKVASVLHPQGNLILFNPSITQIIKAVDTIRRYEVPVYLDRVLELGPYMTGGKEWNVRAVKARASLQAEQERRSSRRNESSAPEAAGTNSDIGTNEGTNIDGSQISATENSEEEEEVSEDEQGFQMICRPKAYARVVGGGFLGLWKKKSPREL